MAIMAGIFQNFISSSFHNGINLKIISRSDISFVFGIADENPDPKQFFLGFIYDA
jgi:hypothetical protein